MIIVAIRLGHLASNQMTVLEDNDNVVRFPQSWKGKRFYLSHGLFKIMILTSFYPFQRYCQGQTEQKILFFIKFEC